MNIYFLLLLILIIIAIYIIYVLFFENDIIDNSGKTYNLNNDGFVILKNILNNDEINNYKLLIETKNYEELKNKIINNDKFKNIIVNYAGNNYTFQDYIWIIQKSSVHTCHRDNNGDFFNKGQKHPSYTMLIYLEDMEKCLGVIPTSHKSIDSFKFNLTNQVTNLLCNKGDIILFNANLIHVGTINKKHDNLRVQMKVTHNDDLSILSYYQNFNKIINQENTIPDYLRKMQLKQSCMMPFISDLTQTVNIGSSRGTDNGAEISIWQKIFSYLYYGNSDFYNLPNAF
jgi:hypothetical protein